MALDGCNDTDVAEGFETGRFLGPHADELVPAQLQVCQSLPRRRSGSERVWRQRLRHGGQHCGIDAVGLGDLPCGPGEIPRPGRVHPRKGQVLGESVPQQAVVASRGLEENEGALRLEARGKLAGGGRRIVEAFGLAGPAIKNVKMGLRDIDFSKTRVMIMVPIPVLRGPCQRPPSTVQVGCSRRAGHQAHLRSQTIRDPSISCLSTSINQNRYTGTQAFNRHTSGKLGPDVRGCERIADLFDL